MTRRKVAIVGTARSSRDLAPYNDPSWEIWCLNDAYTVVPRWDRWFQLHTKAECEKTDRSGELWRWMTQQTKPIYMVDRFEDIPASVKYPLKGVISAFGSKYFTCAVSLMIACALYEGVYGARDLPAVTDLAIYGVDMAQGTEYGEQRPSCEYWLGKASERVNLYVPDESELLKCAWLYGFEDEPDILKKLRVRRLELNNKANQIANQVEALKREEVYLRGAVDSGTYILKNWGKD